MSASVPEALRLGPDGADRASYSFSRARTARRPAFLKQAYLQPRLHNIYIIERNEFTPSQSLGERLTPESVSLGAVSFHHGAG
jgi:hypothetical protein